MKKLDRRKLIAGSLGALVAPKCLYAQSAIERIRFALDWVWQGNHSIWTYGVEEGAFANEKIDLSIERGYGSADNLNKLASGTLDIAFVDPNLLPKFNSENPAAQMQAVCVMYDAAPSAITFLKASGIKTVKDLEGKRLAVTETDASWPLFRVVCQLNGINLDKIKVVNVSPQLRDSLVIQKRVDAALGFFVTSVINMVSAGVPRDDIAYIQYNDTGLELYSLSLICRKAYAAKNPAAVSGFVRGTVRAARSMLANRESAIESLIKRDQLLKPEVEMLRNDLIIDGALLTPWVRKHGLSTVDRERFERTGAQVAKAFNLSVMPKMEDVYTDKFLPPEAERKLV